MAAVYFERGFDVAKDFVQDCLAEGVAAASKEPGDVDPKTQLRQWAEARGLGTPSYEVRASGPSHDVTFFATVRVGEIQVVGEGSSKKSAEADAAALAWRGQNGA